MLDGLPSVKFIDDGPNAPPGGMNAKSWTLWFNGLSRLLKGWTTNAYGQVFPQGVTTPALIARNYANDAAAQAAGVPLGGEYHTAGARKIRIV